MSDAFVKKAMYYVRILFSAQYRQKVENLRQKKGNSRPLAYFETPHALERVWFARNILFGISLSFL